MGTLSRHFLDIFLGGCQKAPLRFRFPTTGHMSRLGFGFGPTARVPFRFGPQTKNPAPVFVKIKSNPARMANTPMANIPVSFRTNGQHSGFAPDQWPIFWLHGSPWPRVHFRCLFLI